MSVSVVPPSVPPPKERALSLYQLLDPEVLANPYPLYRRLGFRDVTKFTVYLAK